MDPENIMLNEKSVMEGQILHKVYLHEVAKIVKCIETENRMVVARCWSVGKMRCCQRIQTFSYKRNKFWAYNKLYGNYSL